MNRLKYTKKNPEKMLSYVTRETSDRLNQMETDKNIETGIIHRIERQTNFL